MSETTYDSTSLSETKYVTRSKRQLKMAKTAVAIPIKNVKLYMYVKFKTPINRIVISNTYQMCTFSIFSMSSWETLNVNKNVFLWLVKK